MATAWRIGVDTPDFEAHDLTGRGAWVTGGRWNRPGLAVVYASRAISLACLETLVHYDAAALPLNRYLVRIDIPEDVWEARHSFDAQASAHVGWDAQPAGRVSLDHGDAWWRAKVSALLEVPSAIVPDESHLLIHPEHPDTRRIRAVKLRRWLYDARLLKAPR